MNCLAEKINFPLDSEAYLRKGRNFFNAGKKVEAIKYIEKAYELDNDPQTNLFLACVLGHYHKYKEALEVMEQEKSFYIDNESHAMVYGKMLIKAHIFLEAEFIIQKYKNDPTKVNKVTWELLEQELIQEREAFNLKESTRKKRVKRTLRTLEEYSQMVQIRKIEEAKLLDLVDLQELAPTILVNADISEIVKRAFLELLIQREDQNSYSFLWFNEIRKVCPADLLNYSEITLVHELNERMEEKLAKYPDLYLRVQIELMHDLLLLYPYIEETITDIDFWIDAYISELDFFNHAKIERLVPTKEQEEMQKWIDYLNTLSQRNQMFKE